MDLIPVSTTTTSVSSTLTAPATSVTTDVAIKSNFKNLSEFLNFIANQLPLKYRNIFQINLVTWANMHRESAETVLNSSLREQQKAIDTLTKRNQALECANQSLTEKIQILFEKVNRIITSHRKTKQEIVLTQSQFQQLQKDHMALSKTHTESSHRHAALITQHAKLETTHLALIKDIERLKRENVELMTHSQSLQQSLMRTTQVLSQTQSVLSSTQAAYTEERIRSDRLSQVIRRLQEERCKLTPPLQAPQKSIQRPTQEVSTPLQLQEIHQISS